jgi:hypothetical protein
MSIRKTRYQTYRDVLVGRDVHGNDIVESQPDKVVTDPPVGVRFTVLEAPEGKVPGKEPYEGPLASINLEVNDTVGASDRLG